MNLDVYQKLVIGFLLKHSKTRQAFDIMNEVREIDFINKASRLAFRYIVECYNKPLPITIPNILSLMDTESMADMGGAESLQYCLEVSRIYQEGEDETGSIDHWVKVVKAHGTYTHVKEVIDSQALELGDLQSFIINNPDPDIYLGNFSTELNRHINGIDTGYTSAGDVLDEVLHRIKRAYDARTKGLIPETTYIYFGWPSFNDSFLPRRRSLVTIGGLPGMGKTTFALIMAFGTALQLYRKNGDNRAGFVTINEFESENWRLMAKVISAMTGVSTQDYEMGNITGQEMERVESIIELLKVIPLFLNDNPSLNTGQMFRDSAALELTHGQKVLGMTDYLDLVQNAHTSRMESEERRVTGITQGVRDMTWKFGSCELLLCQFNRRVWSTPDKYGGPNALLYASTIDQRSDGYLEVYNPPQMTLRNIPFELTPRIRDFTIDGVKGEEWAQNHAFIINGKNRDYPVGRIIPVKWAAEYSRMTDVLLTKRFGEESFSNFLDFKGVFDPDSEVLQIPQEITSF